MEWAEVLKSRGYSDFAEPQDLALGELEGTDVQVFKGLVRDNIRIALASINPELDAALAFSDGFACIDLPKDADESKERTTITNLCTIRDCFSDKSMRRDSFMGLMKKLSLLKNIKVFEGVRGPLSSLGLKVNIPN